MTIGIETTDLAYVETLKKMLWAEQSKQTLRTLDYSANKCGSLIRACCMGVSMDGYAAGPGNRRLSFTIKFIVYASENYTNEWEYVVAKIKLEDKK